MSTALVKLEGLPSEPLARLEDLRSAWDQLAKRANIVSPVASVDSILPMHKISLRAVTIDSTVESQYGIGAEVYKGKFCKLPNERALGKIALEKIMAAAGVQVLDSHRTDDHSNPHYCEWSVTLAIRDFDGQWRQATKSRAVDLRNGSPEAVAMTANQLPAARGHIAANAETKAQLRALRTLLSLKQKYTTEELARPFIIPKLVAALDASDPDQKRALIEMAVQGDRALYGGGPGARETREIEAPKAGNPPPPLPPAPAAAAAPPPVGSVPPSDDDEEDDSEEFDLFEPSEPTKDAVPVFQCGCPCGHMLEVSEEVANATRERFDSIRCRVCAPGKGFDFTLHKDLAGGRLGLKKHPNLTVDELKKQLDAAAAKAKR